MLFNNRLRAPYYSQLRLTIIYCTILTHALIFPICRIYYTISTILYSILYILILGLVCTAFAFSASIEIMKKITPFTVNLSVNLEPIYAIILALLISNFTSISYPNKIWTYISFDHLVIDKLFCFFIHNILSMTK